MTSQNPNHLQRCCLILFITCSDTRNRLAHFIPHLVWLSQQIRESTKHVHQCRREGEVLVDPFRWAIIRCIVLATRLPCHAYHGRSSSPLSLSFLVGAIQSSVPLGRQFYSNETPPVASVELFRYVSLASTCKCDFKWLISVGSLYLPNYNTILVAPTS